jgi:hypothetical protein
MQTNEKSSITQGSPDRKDDPAAVAPKLVEPRPLTLEEIEEIAGGPRIVNDGGVLPPKVGG